MGFARFHSEVGGCCCCFWRHLRLEVFFKRCGPLICCLLPPRPQKYMCILIGFGVFFLCHREKQWQKPSKFEDYAINMQMALLTFLICACFNILNEFLCALVSVSRPVPLLVNPVLRSKLLIMTILRIMMLYCYCKGVAVCLGCAFLPFLSPNYNICT